MKNIDNKQTNRSSDMGHRHGSKGGLSPGSLNPERNDWLIILCLCGIFTIIATVFPTQAIAQENSNLDERPQLLSQEDRDNNASPLQPSVVQPTVTPFEKIDALADRGAIIRTPPPSDSILGDAGGFRSALAERGIGITMLSLSGFAYDLRSPPRSGEQYYNGQKATLTDIQQMWLTYDTDRLGIKGGQLMFGLANNIVTWAPMGPRARLSVSRLTFYDSFLNGKLEVKAGYMGNAEEFNIGAFIGGSTSGSSQGPNAIIPFAVGMSRDPMSAPGINVRYNMGHFYNTFGLQRSISPDGGDVEIDKNPSSLKWSVPGARLLVIDEFGFKRDASRDHPSTWIRVGAMYNKSRFTQFLSPDRSNGNYAFYAAGDYQITQRSGGLPFQGIYTGMSFHYAPQDRNLYTRYMEARLYGIGLLESRPFDMMTLVYGFSDFSNNARAAFSNLGTPTSPNSVSYTASYLARIYKGTYAGFGLGYTKHPTFAPKMKNSLNLTLQLNLFF